MSRLAEMLKAIDKQLAAQVSLNAELLKGDILTAFDQTVARSPVVPLGDGS